MTAVDHAWKRCAGCRAPKPYADFPPDARTSDGHGTHCTTCRPQRSPYDRKRLVLAAMTDAGATTKEIQHTRALFGDRERAELALVALEARYGLVTRQRWGCHLVCDCDPARLRPDNKTCRCGLPVVARMAPELRERMAVKEPRTVTQKVLPYREQVPA